MTLCAQFWMGGYYKRKLEVIQKEGADWVLWVAHNTRTS